MDEAKVIYYLDIWRDYMKGNTASHLGYPSKAAGFMSGGVSSFDDISDEIDIQAAKTVDKVIDDLPKLEKESIYATYLGNKTNLTTISLALNYKLALQTLSVKLPLKNLL